MPAGTADERVLRAYTDYYRARGKTYHVKAQRDSVGRKGRAIPSRAALVEAMFMAELANMVLTAGHDLDAVEPPVRVVVTDGADRYVQLNGTEAQLEAGDMMMADRAGIISSVLRGPDQRTRISTRTRNVLFAAYAPDGIGADTVRRHLEEVQANVLLVAPDAKTELPPSPLATDGCARRRPWRSTHTPPDRPGSGRSTRSASTSPSCSLRRRDCAPHSHPELVGLRRRAQQAATPAGSGPPLVHRVI